MAGMRERLLSELEAMVRRHRAEAAVEVEPSVEAVLPAGAKLSLTNRRPIRDIQKQLNPNSNQALSNPHSGRNFLAQDKRIQHHFSNLVEIADIIRRLPLDRFFRHSKDHASSSL